MRNNMQSTYHVMTGAFLALGVASLALSGCDDPSKGKAKATTSEAVTTTSQSSTAATGSPQNSARYTFDQSTSKVTWVGSKVTGKHDGGFSTFKGTVDAVDGAPERSRVDVDIEATSITSDAEKLTGHLMSQDFFDTKQFPKATFVSTKIEKGGERGATHTITGNLTIKGISKSVTFPANVKVGGDSADVDAGSRSTVAISR